MKVILLSGKGTVTAVGSIDTATGNVNIDTWYDANGRLLQSEPTVNGMYIHNGKKIFINE